MEGGLGAGGVRRQSLLRYGKRSSATPKPVARCSARRTGTGTSSCDQEEVSSSIDAGLCDSEEDECQKTVGELSESVSAVFSGFLAV